MQAGETAGEARRHLFSQGRQHGEWLGATHQFLAKRMVFFMQRLPLLLKNQAGFHHRCRFGKAEFQVLDSMSHIGRRARLPAIPGPAAPWGRRHHNLSNKYCT
jgi:hypothetical protein